jgi:hypothetical protein
MAKDIWDFCQSCNSCQRAKISTTKPLGKTHSLDIPTKPWESIGMDFIGPFPESKGCNYLWVIICCLTSMVHLIPIRTTDTAKDLSWTYIKEIVHLHGLPKNIISDWDSKFTSTWWQEVHWMMGTKLLMSTMFHPQTDGQTERANCNIGQILRTVISHDQKNWVEKIPMTEFAINTSISEMTKVMPFELNYGYCPQMIQEVKNLGGIQEGVKTFTENALIQLAAAHDAIMMQ